MKTRKLRTQEKEFISIMINGASQKWSYLLKLIDIIDVEEMNDGGMGSLKFVSDDDDRQLGELIAEVDFVDSDDIPVSVVLNSDNSGKLFELDVWKVNFDALISWPSKEHVVFRESN